MVIPMFVAAMVASMLTVPEVKDSHPTRFESGTITVPLDWSRSDGPTTAVAYMFVRRTESSRPAAGTIAFVPGGPGGAAISLLPQVMGLFDPMLADHDLLLMDPRGTGESGWLDCEMPADAMVLPRPHKLREIGRCGDKLGDRARYYTSANIADDLDAVRAHVGADRLDVFGISYGSYLSAEYARRHPERVDTMVLSGAFPVAHDSWKRSNAAAVGQALDMVCGSSQCRADLDKVLTSLRAQPVPYSFNVDGTVRTAVLDESALANLMYNASNIGKWDRFGQLPVLIAEAAAGRTDPLVEVARQELLDDYPVPGRADGQSVAQALAVMCNDYPAAYDRRLPVPLRRMEFLVRRALLDKRAFAPFTAAGWTNSMDEGTDLCLNWMANRHTPPVPRGGFPDVAVLAMSGAFDANTTSAEAREAAAQFPRGIAVEVPNAAHIPNLEPTGCANRIAFEFMRHHRTGDLSCLALIPGI